MDIGPSLTPIEREAPFVRTACSCSESRMFAIVLERAASGS